MTEGTRVKQSTKERFNMYEILLSVPEIKHVLSKTQFYYDGTGVISDDVLHTFISAVKEKLYSEYDLYTYSDEDLLYHEIIDSGKYYQNVSRDTAFEGCVRMVIKDMANEYHTQKVGGI